MAKHATMPLLKQKDSAVPPGQTVTAGFPVLHVGDIPSFDPRTWRLRVSGAVENPFELTFDELRALPSTDWRGDIHCVTRWSKLDTHWRGLLFRTLVERAKPAPAATHVIQHADNAYTTNLPLSLMMGDDCLIAYEFDGRPLEPIHGGPVRMLVPQRYFWKSAKWLHGIEFLDHDVKAVTIEIIQKFVADYYNLKMIDLKSRNNAKSVAMPRQIAMYLCKALTHASLPEIGRSFGGKHHSTVIHSIRKVEDLRKKDLDFNTLIGNFLEGFR